MQETVLVTGASGFLGGYLAEGLLRANYKVLAFKRKDTDSWRLRDFYKDIIWFEVDEGLQKPFDVYHINHVIHTATCYGRSNEKSSELVKTNVLFPLRLFELAALFNTDTFFNTDTILYEYLNSYALSKKQFCEWLKLMVNSAIRIINIKLQHMYGPKDDITKFVPYVIHKCLVNEKELPLTKGEQKRDFIYVSDVVAAYLCILRHNQELMVGFNEFAFGSGNATSIKELVQKIAKYTNTKTELLFGALPYRKNEIMNSVADITQLKNFSWKPMVSLDDGIKNTIDYFKS